ncbi:endonuclease/exonuclease/phosphatase family protein [Nocardioides rubriscoriae]|uniref:endonuclease/exonuclease/phosphatase family protein n=1 Tax=Nocardioides rubriscoriae TaxID=642762 RepID=UPI0011E00D98|nr:endonuclease/exonuclease/phosphatase family protein [Nocardioides rubriscoriae]
MPLHRTPSVRRHGLPTALAVVITLVGVVGAVAAAAALVTGFGSSVPGASAGEAAGRLAPTVATAPVTPAPQSTSAPAPTAPATSAAPTTVPVSAAPAQRRRLAAMVRFKEQVRRELDVEKARARARARAMRDATVTFRIGTYNILGSNHVPRGQARAATSAGLITSRGVDLIGLQEVQRDQQGVFESNMPGYSFWPRDALGPQGYRHQVAWRSSMFEFVEGGSVDYTFTSMRIPMPWVLLRHRDTGAELYLINTHNSARDLEGERDSATTIEINLINRLRATGLPVFIVGDMNEHTEFFCRVAPATGMVAANGGSGANGCSLPPGPLRVDWIMGARASFSGYVQDGASISTGASDHYFLHADATIGVPPDPDVIEAAS